MALDLAILGANGRPEMETSLSVDLHTQLIELATQLSLRLLLRLSDYYEDADFAPLEVPALRDEIRKALPAAGEVLRDALEQIDVLLAEAELRGAGVSTIAD